MNVEMSYLIGMICGNGEISRGSTETTVSIDIPHKKLETEALHDVLIYVKASVADIRRILEPLMGIEVEFIQNKSVTVLSFRKANDDYLMREILRYIGDATSHDNIRINKDVFRFTHDEKISFLRGFADVTGYVRRSNYFFDKYMHRVYLEVPRNWYLVVDVCNLLKDVGIPVQNIDWAHPNTRDAKLTKYNQGNPNFWKKEHQIKIFVNEFEPVGFAIIHKNNALYEFSEELKKGIRTTGKNIEKITHKFYWEGRNINKKNIHHPGENDEFIPDGIRGTHYNSWKHIARDLGYVE
jgi:hypothetical protein